MNGKPTNYSELRNLRVLVNFNQPAGYDGHSFQPVVIEAMAEAWTPEGAVRNVSNTLNLGEVSQALLTSEEIYKQVYGISEVLAEALKGVLLEGIAQDVSTVDTKNIQTTTIADIATEAIV